MKIMKLTSVFKSSLLLLWLLSAAQVYAQLTPLSIGSITPNDSVIIFFNVTINNTLPAGTSYIATQATISGSNFSNLVSDDPETTAIPNDSTKTMLHLFPLPVNIVHFRGFEQNGNVELEWKVDQQINVEKYVVERSSDGRRFSGIGDVRAIQQAGEIQYRFTDHQPGGRDLYYRIQSLDYDGKTKYSNIIKIHLSVMTTINIVPNPVRQKSFSLQMVNMDKGLYDVVLYTATGQLVIRRTIDHQGGSQTEQITIPQGAAKGVYNLIVRNGTRMYTRILMIE